MVELDAQRAVENMDYISGECSSLWAMFMPGICRHACQLHDLLDADLEMPASSSMVIQHLAAASAMQLPSDSTSLAHCSALVLLPCTSRATTAASLQALAAVETDNVGTIQAWTDVDVSSAGRIRMQLR